MFHCYRSARQDDDNIELLSADTSMVSLIKSRSNYSTVLTMGLLHVIDIGALLKCRKRNQYNKLESNKVRCNVLPSSSICFTTNMKTAFPSAALPHTDLPFHSISIDVPLVDSEDHVGEITVSYSRKDNPLSIKLPRDRTVIENSINQMKWIASKRGISGTSNICDNLTTDITAKCADIGLYRFRRAEEEAKITSCNVSVSVGTMVQSQPAQSQRSPVKIKEFRRNWWKMSAKILDCNCFKGRCERNPNDD